MADIFKGKTNRKKKQIRCFFEEEFYSSSALRKITRLHLFALDVLLAQWLTQVAVCTGDCDSMEQLGVAFFLFLSFCTTLFWPHKATNRIFYGHDAT